MKKRGRIPNNEALLSVRFRCAHFNSSAKKLIGDRLGNSITFDKVNLEIKAAEFDEVNSIPLSNTFTFHQNISMDVVGTYRIKVEEEIIILEKIGDYTPPIFPPKNVYQKRIPIEKRIELAQESSRLKHGLSKDYFTPEAYRERQNNIPKKRNSRIIYIFDENKNNIGEYIPRDLIRNLRIIFPEDKIIDEQKKNFIRNKARAEHFFSGLYFSYKNILGMGNDLFINQTKDQKNKNNDLLRRVA